ncbi:MAG: alcohol dehydrogenase catalytic domain-containing protein [Halioglobus sp.]|nr:alcohol dehydrogenase catalytic domain-containing protein [Halioglobus sp.]
MMQIPQARIHAVDDLRLDTIAPPECGPDDVVVRVRQCGICGSDLSYLAMGGIAAPDTPMPIGHELWGEIGEAGANVTHVAAGDRVVVQPLCNDTNIGNGGSEGGFTPLLLVRNAANNPDSVIKLPDDLPVAYGALVEPLAVAQHSANRVMAAPTDRAVIYGAGPIGLSILQVLKYRGLEDIVVIDLSPLRLETAAGLGAVALRGDDPELARQLIDIHGSADFFGLPMPASTLYFEATGARSVFEGMLDVAGPGSRICLTGVHKEPATLDLVMLLAKEISLVPALAYAGEFAEVIDMLGSGAIDPSVMVTHEFPLSNIDSAFATARDTGRAIKVIVDCQA